MGRGLSWFGILYLGYARLGGQHGPLRLLTRAVTYAIVFGVGYGLGLGPFFGLVSGIATGITLALELNRVARGREHYSLPWEALFSATRAIGVGTGLYRIVGLEFAVVFAIIVTVGQIVGYSRGMRPPMDYEAARRPRLTRRQFWGTVVRTFYFATALICSSGSSRGLVFRNSVGLVTGIVTGVGDDHSLYRVLRGQPAGALAQAFGIGLILCGFALNPCSIGGVI